MPADQRVIITHIFSQGQAAAKATGTRTGGGTANLIDAAANFVAAGVAVGDVVRFTGPNAIKGQAVVVDQITSATELHFYVPMSGDSTGAVFVGDAYRVETPRQGEDVSASVGRIEIRDYLNDLAKQCIIELANTNRQYEGKFAARDPVEVWIDDDDAATAAPTFPASVTDVTTPVENSRAFIGRIDAIERDVAEGGEILRIFARNYAGDLLDTPVDAVFINTFMLPKTPAGATVFPNVAEALQRLFNGQDNTALTDQLDDYKAGKCGLMRDRATGRPTFALATTDPSGGAATNPQGDIAFSTESFFDAYAKIAGVCSQLSAGIFLGEPLKFWVDDWTYHPRKQDATGAGVDDPRPTAGANTSGAGNPTINLKRPDEAQGAALPFSIVEGTNAVSIHPRQDSERTRNTLTVLGTRNDDAPIVMQKRQAGSFQDAHGQPVLGRDRYGELGNVAQAKGFFDTQAADAATTAALVRTRPAKERRSVVRTMAIVPGRSLAGAVVTANVPSASLNQSVGIAGVRHQWAARGLTSEFDLTFIRPGWDRLLAPIERAARDIIREDVWKAWYCVIMDVDGSANLTFKRAATHEYGDTTKETTLYTVANPPQATYPTSNGAPWFPAGFRFYNGLLFVLWRDTVINTAQNPDGYRILFQLLNAYDGTPAVASIENDGIYDTFDNFSAVYFDAGASVAAPEDIWVEAHVNAGANPTVNPVFSVWIASNIFAQRFTIKRTAAHVGTKDAVQDITGGGVQFDGSPINFFLEERDDGHVMLHSQFETASHVFRWSVFDLTEPGNGRDHQEFLETDTAPWSITSDRSGRLAVYVVGDRDAPFTPMRLKMTSRWGTNGWERSLGTGTARNLSVRTDPEFPLIDRVVGRVDIVPYTRFFFFL